MKKIETELLRKLIAYDPETGEITYRTGFRAGSRPISVKHGYLLVNIESTEFLAHRLAWQYMTGEAPPMILDHKNGNTLDNRWENIRNAKSTENAWNARKSKNNTSGYKGVSLCKTTNRWRASIAHNGKRIQIGRFDTKEEAARAYAQMAIELHGEFSRVE